MDKSEKIAKTLEESVDRNPGSTPAESESPRLGAGMKDRQEPVNVRISDLPDYCCSKPLTLFVLSPFALSQASWYYQDQLRPALWYLSASFVLQTRKLRYLLDGHVKLAGPHPDFLMTKGSFLNATHLFTNNGKNYTGSHVWLNSASQPFQNRNASWPWGPAEIIPGRGKGSKWCHNAHATQIDLLWIRYIN